MSRLFACVIAMLVEAGRKQNVAKKTINVVVVVVGVAAAANNEQIYLIASNTHTHTHIPMHLCVI